MTLAKAKACAKAKVKHICSTGIINDRHLRSSKYFYSTGHWSIIDNRTTHIRHQCRKTAVLSCHRFIIKTGAEKMNNI